MLDSKELQLVKQVHFGEAERRVAAAAIEARIGVVAARFGIGIGRCVWNLDLGMNHSGPHRLDMHLEEEVVRLYFSDHELCAYWETGETTNTELRLQEFFSRLPDLLGAVAAVPVQGRVQAKHSSAPSSVSGPRR